MGVVNFIVSMFFNSDPHPTRSKSRIILRSPLNTRQGTRANHERIVSRCKCCLIQMKHCCDQEWLKCLEVWRSSGHAPTDSVDELENQCFTSSLAWALIHLHGLVSSDKVVLGQSNYNIMTRALGSYIWRMSGSIRPP